MPVHSRSLSLFAPALLGALALMADAAAAQVRVTDFNGNWTTGQPFDCVTARGEFHAMSLRNGTWERNEGVCALTNPVAVRGMRALLFDAQCYGEGPGATYRTMLMLDRSGRLIEVVDGSVTVYNRCQ